jgi:hypothetical protein
VCVRVLCLANSVKLLGRCIAGIDLATGQWVRPVPHEGGAYDLRDVRYQDGLEMQVLDVFDMEPVHGAATLYHPEDLVVTNGWRFVRTANDADLAMLGVRYAGGPELLRGCDSYIACPITHDQALHASLTLVSVWPSSLWLRKERKEQRTRYRAAFYVGRERMRYDLPLTDPIMRERLDGLDFAEYRPSDLDLPDERLTLTISLSEPFVETGRCYKLVAAIFPR